MENSFLIQTKDLVKTYRMGQYSLNALNKVTLDFKKGEFAGLVGPSGSGKTTLLNIVGSLDTPSEGSAVVMERKIEELSHGQAALLRNRYIGFIFQTNNLFPFLTARENLLLMNKIGPGDRHLMNERAQQLLDELGLTSRANALVTELSGGERQRVAIARALMRDPEMVLADEPTANLDSELGKRVVQNLVDGVKERNKIGIMVTHDLNMAALADGILEMRDGHLSSDLFNGTPLLPKQDRG